ncbi:bifunctional [glutamate--ammonia ligase]-adenylyl-L-tyrosine phosphorylase/[glutamate--ammonia-ligase] adenylyltransferase [Thalassotalea atypica]|uniref:bifunctional [glutamate--ammonia ligase]-adenylyl-L-tyrosine phosphorylase/[glutamate--ammonia-ligase] adenylyltransferase n=1 Tax=Thalassotalea atypica TaxID=2054316 RepID=UPI00257226A5|nr:bifunctional [glutamate--ammonia ligase]-adenylyl-L-tyrosine phosphorylase/[glutamate--ammonia-ligase] adenylyltransferase [Thalassotalea atypica]
MTIQGVHFSLPLLNLQKEKSLSAFLEHHRTLFEQLDNSQQQNFINAITLSDFVHRSAMQAPNTVISIFQHQHYNETFVPDYLAELKQRLANTETEEALHKSLRIFRLEMMVQVAIGDLVLDHPLEISLLRLSNLADALIIAALDWLSEFCAQRWGTPISRDGETQSLLVYGMGKLGGQELNFSSDIDLIFAYPETGETIGARRTLDNQQFFTRLGQKLITALHNKTADGFVYRVDMRLRPFGESGPLVMSFNALEDYYQEQGRDWERYAMLKARLIGQGKHHQQLNDMLRPFVYRRYIDFSVIDSLRKMKMMIAQEVRRRQLVHNIKLGAGGIREIEFIVQVFQLIRGGRLKELQRRNLLSVVPLLVEHDVIDESSAKVLTDAYVLLRRVENIIQAVGDQQTQTLPDTELDQARLLHVLKIDSWSELLTLIQVHMQGVHQAFIGLIGEDSPNHQNLDEQWSTLWLSEWTDEETCDWLKQLAPAWNCTDIWSVLSQFRQESTKRRIGVRGRQVLDKLMPMLIQHVYQARFNEQVLSRVLVVIDKILTRTAYLELLFENEGALVHLIKLCEMSEWLAVHIAKYPLLLDELIDPKLLHNPPALSSYQDELQQVMLRVPENDVEVQMETLRQFKQAQQLRIAAADIVEVLPVMQVSDHLTSLAQAIVDEVVQQAWHQVTARFGQPKSTVSAGHKGFAVIGYGKMGGVELSYGSDLDLVFIHDCPTDDVTNGEREVPVSQFYLKLAQKIMHLFNTRMSSGILYELDMRLRPSGNSGVLTIHIDAFDQYQKNEAWTWEHQALVRARAIYGHASLINAFERSRTSTLSAAREVAKLKADVIEMRDKMRKHLDKSKDCFVDIKQAKGGLVDIEFIVQFLVLKHAQKHNELCRYSDNFRLITLLADLQVLTSKQQKSLIESYQQLRALGHRLSLQNKPSLVADADFKKYSDAVHQTWKELLQ